MNRIAHFFQLPSLNPEYVSYLYIPPLISLESIFVSIVESIHPLFFITAIVILLLAWFVWIKLRYPFWSCQPVKHTYSWLPKRGLMHPVLPKTKFYEPQKVKTATEILEPTRQEICRLLQSHWIPSDRAFCDIQPADLADFAVASMFQDGKGCVISRTAHLYIPDASMIPVLVQDYFAVGRDEPVDTARRLFDSHEYNCRVMKPEYKVSVFKKEVDLLEGVVPWIEYTCSTFPIENRKLRRLPPDFTVVRVQKQNTDLLHDFLRSGIEQAVVLDIGTLLAMLKTNQMYMYGLKRGDQVFALYWFKNAHVRHEDMDGNALHFIASFRNTENDDLFSLGFSHSLREVLREYREYRVLMMDSIGANGEIVELWKRTHRSIGETRCAYYLYNWGIPQMMDKEKCLVIV